MTSPLSPRSLLTIAIVLGGGGFLVYSSVSHAQHYMMVDELVKTPLEEWNGKELKVHGLRRGGQHRRERGRPGRAPLVRAPKRGQEDPRVLEGPKPDTFKDQSEVVATGRLVKANEMQALATELCKPEDDDADRDARSAAMPSRPGWSTRPI